MFRPKSTTYCVFRVFGWSSALGAVALGGKVYICGGFDGASSLNSVEMYDPEMDEWTMVSSMEKHRSASGVVVLDSQIYAIGGHDGLSIFDSVSFSLSVTGIKGAAFRSHLMNERRMRFTE